jgi:gliding motility-associated-like protein
MEGKDPIKELFSQKLGNYEVPVNPELWSSIASQIPSTSTAATTGVGLVTKIVIGISVAASLVTGIYFLQAENKVPEVSKVPENYMPSVAKPGEESDNKLENSEVESKTKNAFEQKYQEQPIQKENSIESEVINNSNSSIIALVTNEVDLKTQSILNEENSSKQESAKSEKNNQELPTVNETKDSTPLENVNPSPVVNSPNLPKESSIQVTLPNVFTPNGDGANDYFQINMEEINEFSVVVLNENGQVVYQSQDSDFKWDGYSPNGVKVPQGTYVYYITGKDSKGKLVSKHSRLVVKY